MDLNGVRQFMAQQERADTRPDQHDRDNIARIKATQFLDRVDIKVGHTGAGSFETVEGISKTLQDESGALEVFQMHLDSDGDWMDFCSRVYAGGFWRWVEAEVVAVPNPFYVEPAACDQCGALEGQPHDAEAHVDGVFDAHFEPEAGQE